MASMATKRSPHPTRELRQHEFSGWLTSKLGDGTIQGLADKLDTKRQTLSGIISGRREPGKTLQAKFKKLGLRRVERIYVVVDEAK
jgi:hypothetical protein